MNGILWVVQVLLGLMFMLTDSGKAFRPEAAKKRDGMAWMGAVPRPLLTFIGLAELLGGLGLIVPAATGILPWLTPLAAGLLALVMVLAIAFHVPRGEYRNITANVVLGLLA